MKKGTFKHRHEFLRKLYSPYTFGVFTPFLGVSTVAWGTFATALAKFSPRLAFHCGTAWARTLCELNCTKVEIIGREKADPDQSYIIMTNHQSHFDVLAFYGHWKRQFRWVMKEELRHIPGLGPACVSAGHVFIDRSSHAAAIESLRKARELLEGGISVVIFPEGTRSRDGRMGPFKKGGFMMALDTGLPILPVSISGSREVLPAHTAKLLPGRIRLTVHDPVDPNAYGHDRRADLMADVRRAIASGLRPEERGPDDA